MTDQFVDANKMVSITPPPELVMQWVSLACEYEGNETWIDLATQAANWGSDQELEACCEWLKAKEWIHPEFSDELRAARRPKSPSLAEQALEIAGYPKDFWSEDEVKTIRRALERLQELENNG